MRRFQLLVIALFAGTQLQLSGHAQVDPRVARAAAAAALAGVPYGNYSFSSTPYESAQRGFAEVLRAQGEAALAGSAAAINLQEARSRYIDNSLKWTQTYWERKRLGEAELAADRERMRERRDRYLEYKRSRPSQPSGLGRSQIDPATGELDWPFALGGDLYAIRRDELEELFQLRAQTGATPDLVRRIQEKAEEMRQTLNSQIRDMPPNDYIAARKFIDGLVEEARPST